MCVCTCPPHPFSDPHSSSCSGWVSAPTHCPGAFIAHASLRPNLSTFFSIYPNLIVICFLTRCTLRTLPGPAHRALRDFPRSDERASPSRAKNHGHAAHRASWLPGSPCPYKTPTSPTASAGRYRMCAAFGGSSNIPSATPSSTQTLLDLCRISRTTFSCMCAVIHARGPISFYWRDFQELFFFPGGYDLARANMGRLFRGEWVSSTQNSHRVGQRCIKEEGGKIWRRAGGCDLK